MDTKKYTFELLKVKPMSGINQKKSLSMTGVNALKKIKDTLTPTKKKMGGLTGGQKKIDANKDGKISGEDFKILRGARKGMKMGGVSRAKRLAKKISKRPIPEIKADAAKKGGMMKKGMGRKKARGN